MDNLDDRIWALRRDIRRYLDDHGEDDRPRTNADITGSSEQNRPATAVNVMRRTLALLDDLT